MAGTSKTQRPIVSIVHRNQVPGEPDKYSQSDLTVVREMVKEALDLAGGLESFIKASDKVMIKPNCLWAIGPEAGFSTDPRVVEAVVGLIREEINPREIVVAERTALGKSSAEAFEATGIGPAAMRAGADRILPLEDDARVTVRIPRAKALLGEVAIPKIVFDSDVIVYLPKLKTHKQAVITINMKLSHGLMTWSDMLKCHRFDLEAKFVDMMRVVKPHLSVVDAIWANQGQGPGSPYVKDLVKDMNLIMAGGDPVAVDAVGAAIMGIDPLFEVGMIRAAAQDGLGEGNLENIEVRGRQIDEVRRYFRRGSISLIGLHPKIDVYAGGACNGCAGFTRTGIDPLLGDHPAFVDGPKKLAEVDKITCILGRATNVPDALEHNPPHSYVFVIGNCAEEHKDRGIFLPGCSSTGLHDAFTFLGLGTEECERIYQMHQPHGMVP